MEKDSTSTPNIQSNFEINTLDIESFIDIFSRKKWLILSVSSLFIFLTLIYILFKKRVWEGEFQIVLDNQNQSISSAVENNISNMSSNFVDSIVSNTLGGSDLKTEVAILTSPSVLMPIYEFVNEEKKKNNKYYKPDPFFKWEEQIAVGLEKGTSVLNIIYKDDNKNLVLPVLKKISNAYQDYSGRDKRRVLELEKKYLIEQISLYKIKSSKSLKEAQEFAIDQDMTLMNINSFGSQQNNMTNNFQSLSNIQSVLSSSGSGNIFSNNDYSILSNTDIESFRVSSANQIRNIDLQLKKIDELESDSNLIQYLSFNIPELVTGQLAEDLQDTTILLNDIKSRYKPGLQRLEMLSKKKELLIDELKTQAIGLLKVKRMKLEAEMEAATRPKGTILKYKNLIRDAARDENTLIALENKLRLLNLNESKIEDPWELITNPTLKPFPIEPNKPRAAILGLVIGIFSAFSFAFYKENQTGLVYEDSFYEKLFKTNFLEKINLSSSIFSINSREILKDEILQNKSEKQIIFISSKKTEKSQSQKLFEIIFGSNNQFVVEENFNKLTNNNLNILIVNRFKESKKDLINIKHRLDMKGKQIFGMILIDE